ncbi:hypothetical protein [uncultured Vagococcus sp.]|uniref:hypothetical protein n=1 Tax=uncultured Vagococcus sp. TaxID=189676 RepID=UPI0028D0D8E2|nr:hypothetical protein [uncultured Vagococcus sp.]
MTSDNDVEFSNSPEWLKRPLMSTLLTHLSKRTILAAEDWVNNYSYKILQDKAPSEVFAEELLKM